MVACCKAVQTTDVEELGRTSQQWQEWKDAGSTKLEEYAEGFESQNGSGNIRVAAHAERSEEWNAVDSREKA